MCDSFDAISGGISSMRLSFVPPPSIASKNLLNYFFKWEKKTQSECIIKLKTYFLPGANQIRDEDN